MGRGWLWALDKRGIAYRLSASEPVNEVNDKADEKGCVYWQKTACEVPLRKLSASATCAWAIGANSKPYMFLYGSDCPCRITEEVYENQRWYPMSGFTSHLLPTERDVWSDAAGDPSRAPEQHGLPSAAWEWEDPWMPECNPRLADKQGWMYAANFNRPFSSSHWPTAFVRRRKWIRTRRYKATDCWVKIDIPPKYALTDITVGGTDVPGQAPGFLCVWALASSGKVLFRSGISRQKPEGELWYAIDPPSEAEFNNLSCSPSTGRLLAVSWEGRIFQRTGQLNTDFMGSDWAELPSPVELRFLSVAVGEQAVWAITMDGRVWFARMNTEESGESLVCEIAWLDMNCPMSHLSIGPADQVFGVGLIDDSICYRTDITDKELSGHSWQTIVSRIASERTNSDSESVSDPINGKTITVFDGRTVARNVPLHRPRAPSGGASQIIPLVVSYRRSNVANGVVRLFSTEDKKESKQQNGYSSDSGKNDSPVAELEYEQAQDCASDDCLDKESTMSICSEAASLPASDLNEPFSGTWTEQDETDSMSSSTMATVTNRSNNRWVLISAGGCFLSNSSLHENAAAPRFWFDDPDKVRSFIRQRKTNDFKTPWRRSILKELKNRNAAIWAAFNDFTFAFDQDTWTRTLSAHVWSGHYRKWCEVVLHLTQSWRPGQRGQSDEDRSIGLTIKFTETKKNGNNGKTGRVDFQDILCVRRDFDSKANKLLLVLYVRKIEGDPGVQWDFPLKFACQSEDDQKMWTLAIDEAASRHQCSLIRSLLTASVDPIGPNAVWAVAANGAVYVSQPGERCLIRETRWRLLGGHFKLVEAGLDGVVWALGYDGRPWIFAPSSPSQIQDDVRTDVVYENQRWSRLLMKYIPIPRLMSGHYYAWSDETGKVNTPKESFKLPGSEWQWLSDWKVDFSSDSDPDGWQFSKSFRSPFMAQKKFNYSAVRRRRWTRKRRVITASNVGSWRLVDLNPNIAGQEAEFSRLIVESSDTLITDKEREVLVFAVTTDGDLFCRIGVTMDRPEGTAWQHVLINTRIVDVSLGLDRKLWAIGQNGFAYCCYAANHEDLLSSGWHEILPPENGQCRLTRVVAGSYTVYAMDAAFRLFCRLGITPWCPEGVAWVPVINTSATIEHISLSKDDQLWALLKSSSPHGCAIGRRYDIRGYNSLWDIDWWDIANVDGWAHVSASNYASFLCSGMPDKKDINVQPRQVLGMVRMLSKPGVSKYA